MDANYSFEVKNIEIWVPAFFKQNNSSVPTVLTVLIYILGLRSSISGYVLFRGSPDFETARAVHNGGCRNIYPLILVKPLSTQDVSVAVKFAVYYDLKISVRSGGHSYQCLGTKVSTKSSFLIPILFYRKIITFKSKKQKQKV